MRYKSNNIILRDLYIQIFLCIKITVADEWHFVGFNELGLGKFFYQLVDFC